MKAAILEKINEPLVIGNVETTELLFGHVMVKMLVSGICGAQLLEIGGHKGNAKFVPHLMGHEGCGIVEDIGPGVTKVKKGDKVVLHWRKGSGIESEFPVYEYNGKRMPSGKVTTFNEVSVVSENRVTPIPHDIPDDFCALLGCGLSTALGVVEHDARVMSGESVLVAGVGGLGANIIKAAKLANAYPIIALDIHDSKKKYAQSLGADLFVNTLKKDVKTEMERLFSLKDVEVIVETSGNAKSIASTLSLLRGSGRYIMLGQPKPGETVEITNAHHLFGGEGKTIKATQGGCFMPDRDIPRYIALYRSGKLSIEGLITHRVKLKDINKGIDLVRNGKALRVFVDICKK